MSKMDKLKEIIRELVKKELEEVTTSGDIAGYETPNAFTGGVGKGKKKKKEISTNSTGYNVVRGVSITNTEMMIQCHQNKKLVVQ